jgi:glycosyltransferase involved in cell wall biosynthesis
MATYNGESHLRAQLDSFVAQTRPPDEVVISDDGSTDGTVDLVDRWASEAPFDVKVMRDGHVGCSQNFGRALAATGGDLVFLSDQDDVWMPHKIERVIDAAESAPDVSVFIHDLELVGPNLEHSGQSKLDRLSGLGFPERAHIKGCCTAIRRSALDAALPIPVGEAHDAYLHALGGDRLLTRERLIRYRIHETNTSTWQPNSLTPITRRYLLKRDLRLRAGKMRARLRHR